MHRLVDDVICDIYRIEWNFTYRNSKDVFALEKAVNESCKRAISCTVVLHERKLIWIQALPVGTPKKVIECVDPVAQIFARRFHVELTNPRLVPLHR